jgi:hypothetical protein
MDLPGGGTQEEYQDRRCAIAGRWVIVTHVGRSPRKCPRKKGKTSCFRGCQTAPSHRRGETPGWQRHAAPSPVIAFSPVRGGGKLPGVKPLVGRGAPDIPKIPTGRGGRRQRGTRRNPGVSPPWLFTAAPSGLKHPCPGRSGLCQRFGQPAEFNTRMRRPARS